MIKEKINYIQKGKDSEIVYEVIPPLPTASERGGILASPKTDVDTIEAKLGEDGKIYTSNHVFSADKLTTEQEITIGQNSRMFDGTSPISWSLEDIGAINRYGDDLDGNFSFSGDMIFNTDYNNNPIIIRAEKDDETQQTKIYQDSHGFVFETSDDGSETGVYWDFTANGKTANNIASIIYNGENTTLTVDKVDAIDGIFTNGEFTSLSCSNILDDYSEVAVATETGNFVDAVAIAQLITKLKNVLCKGYKFIPTVTNGANYTSVTVDTVLYANCLHIYVDATRKTDSTSGDVENEIVCSITVDSSNKIESAKGATAVSGSYGVASSFTTNTIEVNDGVLKFNILLCATHASCNRWSFYMTLPVRVNLDSY